MLWKYKKCYQETNEDIIGTCNTYTLTVEQTDLDISDDGIVYWDFADCATGEVQTRQHNFAGTYNRCVKEETGPIVYIYVDSVVVVAIDSVAVITGSC